MASVLLTTIARWLVALLDAPCNPTPGCNHASNGWLGLTTNKHLGVYRGDCWYRLLWTPVTQGGHHGRGGIQRLAERDCSTDAAAAATGLADVGLGRGFGLR